MTPARLSISAAVCVGLVALSALVFSWPLEKAALLAPVIVVTVGLTAAVAVLWVRVGLESLRRQRHPVRIVAGAVAVLAVLVVLSFFVELPASH